jgi:hypothetical protein
MLQTLIFTPIASTTSFCLIHPEDNNCRVLLNVETSSAYAMAMNSYRGVYETTLNTAVYSIKSVVINVSNP